MDLRLRILTLTVILVILPACSPPSPYYATTKEVTPKERQLDFDEQGILLWVDNETIKKRTTYNRQSLLSNEDLDIISKNGGAFLGHYSKFSFMERYGQCYKADVEGLSRILQISYDFLSKDAPLDKIAYLKFMKLDNGEVLISYNSKGCLAEGDSSENLDTIYFKGNLIKDSVLEIPMFKSSKNVIFDVESELALRSEWFSEQGTFNRLRWGLKWLKIEQHSKWIDIDGDVFYLQINDIDGVTEYLKFLYEKFSDPSRTFRFVLGDFPSFEENILSQNVIKAMEQKRRLIKDEKRRVEKLEEEKAAEAKRQKEAELARQREEAERQRLASLPKIKAGNTYYAVSVNRTVKAVTLAKLQPVSPFSKTSYEEILLYTKGANRNSQGVTLFEYDRGEIMSKQTLDTDSQQFRIDKFKRNYGERNQCSRWEEVDTYQQILKPFDNDIISPKGNMWTFSGGRMPGQKDDFIYCSKILYDRNNCRIHDCKDYKYASSSSSDESYLFDNYDDALQKYNSTTMY